MQYCSGMERVLMKKAEMFFCLIHKSLIFQRKCVQADKRQAVQKVEVNQ